MTGIVRWVVVTERAKKDLRRAPKQVVDKFALWARAGARARSRALASSVG